jgi:alkylation response protein AidB-like acyl-CoA dehydrogenase
MADYTPPLDDMRFLLDHVIGLGQLAEHEDLGVLDIEMVDSVLTPAAKLASEVLAPLNWSGDQDGTQLKDGVVTTAKGFKHAYAEYRDGGWNAVPFDSAYGGQNLPWLIAFPLQEMWQGANMSFGLCPLLNQGAVEAIHHHGSQEQKDYYLEKLISGEWTGTMNLTEPQAGSDLAAIRTKAEPESDHYKIFGQKIYITYGEHDFADNIIHLVLARLPDAPEGVKGISLFIVPKILEDGSRNDVKCTGIEHKLGILASPTCTMQFGDNGGAIGYLVGEANEGLKYMFTMMNNARLSVGLQGVAIAEASYQHALAYAKDREQGYAISAKDKKRVTISEHADVKRMLMSMKAQIEAYRALTYEAALNLDLAAQGNKKAQARVDLLTPLVKAGATDMSLEVTSTGVQIHGGMGFVEETGAAQFYRDARILPIYEGTNGIQAADLLFRKTLRDGGEVAKSYIGEMKNNLKNIQSKNDKILFMKEALEGSIEALEDALASILVQAKENLESAAASSVPYLNCFATVACAGMMLCSAANAEKLLNEEEGNQKFFNEKINTAYFFMAHILPKADAYSIAVQQGADSILEANF